MADRPSEYIRFIDAGNDPSLTMAWTLTSPNVTVWSPSVSTAGVVTMTDGAVAGTVPIFIGLDGNAWNPTIDNSGIITATTGSPMASTDQAASILDSNGLAWTFYVDTDNIVNLTTNAVLPALFRYPSVVLNWTPTASTDQLVISSLRAQMTIRRRTS